MRTLSSRQMLDSAPAILQVTRRDVFALAAFALAAGAPRLAGAAGPEGQLTWGVHV